jgi:hypothetical protein
MTRWLFLTILTASLVINCATDIAAQTARKACWVADVTKTTGVADFVDGIRVPDELGIVNYLRQQERKTSQRPCLLGFVTPSAQIADVDNLRKIAGKIGFEEIHVYLYEQEDPNFAREILWTPQVSAHVERKGARVVDITSTKSGEVDYVDGRRVPAEMTLVDYLRQQEKTSRRMSLLILVPDSEHIADVENLRRVAREMRYEEFHAYVRDSVHRNVATELLYGPPANLNGLRIGPRGSVPWPDRQPAKKD